MTLAGRLDAAEVPRFGPALQAVIDGAAAGTTVDLDLASVNFFDSRALVGLITARTTAHTAGIILNVTATSLVVRIMLELTGVNSQLQPAAA